MISESVLWHLRCGLVAVQCTVTSACAGVDVQITQDGLVIRRERYPDPIGGVRAGAGDTAGGVWRRATGWSNKSAELDCRARFRLNRRDSPKAVGARKGAPATLVHIHRPAGRADVVVSPPPQDRRPMHRVPNGMPVEVQVVQDRDIVLTELFQEEWLALNWAKAYCARLKLQGWEDSPMS